jgi:muconolactone delta-isomerase
MEYLVTMTTHVPPGTPAEAVDDVRAAEAAYTRVLAAQGHVLRLWRPPLAPGEWRTLGLFAAADSVELAAVLASMPLKIWRSDEISPLSAHPNDPPATRTAVPSQGAETMTEFLVTFTPAVPAGTPAEDLAEATAGEAARARKLARQRHLVRLWTLPGEHDPRPALGLWRASGAAEMQSILESLPGNRYLTTRTTKLTPHPSDPAAPRSRPLRVASTGRP